VKKWHETLPGLEDPTLHVILTVVLKEILCGMDSGNKKIIVGNNDVKKKSCGCMKWMEITYVLVKTTNLNNSLNLPNGK
jgi:hypothetical protein